MVRRRPRRLAGGQFRELGVSLDDNRNERTRPNDAMSRVVAEPFQNSDDKLGARTGVAHGWENLGVKEPSHAVRHLEIDPADGFTVAKSNDSVVRNLNIHDTILLVAHGGHGIDTPVPTVVASRCGRFRDVRWPVSANLEGMFRSVVLVAVSALVLTGCAAPPNASEIPGPTQQAPTVTTAPPTTATVAVFDTTSHSIDEADSLWVVVDKLRRLTPKRYAPKGLTTMSVPHVYTPVLRRDAAKAYQRMFRAARRDGIDLVVQSSYRSYATQVSVYNRGVEASGREAADQKIARPGYSEHQIGLSVDIAAADRACTIRACFGRTPEGKWLMRNAPRFGWHLRYPKGKTAITGYIYEPWHWRFVGVELAMELSLTPRITLEEFFGLPAAPDYPN
jgi:D-alanyl-D-alanine carboxypeptidase